MSRLARLLCMECKCQGTWNASIGRASAVNRNITTPLHLITYQHSAELPTFVQNLRTQHKRAKTASKRHNGGTSLIREISFHILITTIGLLLFISTRH